MKYGRALMIALCFCVGGLHAHNVMADEDGDCQGNCPDGGDTYNINVPIAKGGSAYAKGGNAKAYGGDGGEGGSVYLGYGAVKGGSAYQGQGQGQDQEQDQDQSQYSKNINANGQGQALINKGPQVVITETITYEQAASPAIAADVNAPAPTAGCRYSRGFSIAASVVAGSGSVGHSTSEYDPICGAWMAAEQTAGDAKTIATTVAYCLTMAETGVEVAGCGDWKGKVSRGLNADGTWIAARVEDPKVEETEESEDVALWNPADR